MTPVKNIISSRYAVIFAIIAFGFIAVCVKLVNIRYFERDELLKAEKFDEHKKFDIKIFGERGDIYAADCELLSTTFVYHKVYMDFGADWILAADCTEKAGCAKDSLQKYLPELAQWLSAQFKDKSAKSYEQSIKAAYKAKNRRYELCPDRISHSQFQRMLKLPLFSVKIKKTGIFKKAIIDEKEDERYYPYGGLAKQTIGNRIIAKARQKNSLYGIEKEWNDSLAGKVGLGESVLVGGRRMERCYEGHEARDGYDIHTTIDIRAQEIADRALRKKLSELDAATGCLLLMKVRTGELRAMVNLQRNAEGGYSEQINMAFGDYVSGEDAAEPGSTFKVPVMIALLESGRINLNTEVDVEDGIIKIKDVEIKDDKDHIVPGREHYYVKPEEVIVSSLNTGIAKLLWQAYGEKGEMNRFYEQLFKTGINTEVDFRVSIYNYRNVKKLLNIPQSNKRGEYLKMSYGYSPNMHVPPVNMLMFYNAIANDGKMVKPYFIKSLNKDNKVVYEFDTEVINPQICEPKTLKTIQSMLGKVVSDKHGTAHRTAKSKAVTIAGKTGTAQLHNRSGWQATFAGYFSIDGEMYSAIAVMRGKSERMYGSAAAAVVKEVAEKMYAGETTLPLDSLKADTNDIKIPSKNGYYSELKKAAKELGININGNSGGEWVRTTAGDNAINTGKANANPLDAVKGMGLNDAVYLLERNGYVIKGVRGAGAVANDGVQRNGNQIILTLK